MKDYFVIWRFFPKLFIGAAFVFELLSVIWSVRILGLVSETFYGLATHFSGPTLLVSLIIVLALISNLGVWGLTLFCGIAGGLFRRIFSGWLAAFKIKGSWLQDLVQSPTEMAIRLFNNNPTFYSEWFQLRNLSTSELDKKKALATFTDEVRQHISTLQTWDGVDAINQYTALAQDQVRVDKIADEIQTLWNLIVTLLLLPWALAMLDPIARIVLAGVVLISGAGILPQIIRRKRYLAVFIIIGYLDIFSFGPTSIQEREGETLL